MMMMMMMMMIMMVMMKINDFWTTIPNASFNHKNIHLEMICWVSWNEYMCGYGCKVGKEGGGMMKMIFKQSQTLLSILKTFIHLEVICRVSWNEYMCGHGRKVGKERMVALRPHTPKHIRGGWSHYTDTSEPVEVMGPKIWSLSNPGFEPPTFRSLVQRANHCTNRAHCVKWWRRGEGGCGGGRKGGRGRGKQIWTLDLGVQVAGFKISLGHTHISQGKLCLLCRLHMVFFDYIYPIFLCKFNCW
jgi:hypothetical protein